MEMRRSDRSFRRAGCLNGGGQLKPRPGQTQQQLIAALDDVYNRADILFRPPEVRSTP